MPKKKPSIYVTKGKKIIRRKVELIVEERAYLGGGVGMHLSIGDISDSVETVPTNNELGISDNSD